MQDKKKNKNKNFFNLCEQFAKLRGEFLPDIRASAAEQTEMESAPWAQTRRPMGSNEGQQSIECG